MSEQTQDWKEERITEYAKLENEIAIETHELITDPERNRLIKEKLLLSARIEEVEKIHHKNIEAAQQQQAGIKVELIDKWYSEDKTFECAVGTATLRTTKSLHIWNKEKLIDFLVTINKLSNFIKSFEITKLRKIKDAGMLEDEIATYDEKKNVAIKITEVEQ
jgi:hypothetical protein